MIVPVRLAVALALLLGAATRAEAAPSRMKRDRPVAVTVTPAEPLPEIHIAPDVPTGSGSNPERWTKSRESDG